MWREIEESVGKTLLEDGTILNYGHPSSEFLQGIFSHFPENKILTGEEIMEKFPAFKNIPKEYIGMAVSQGNSFLG